MANIIYTKNCNIKCPYCFATESNKNFEGTFDIANTWEITQFLTSNEFRFCGGEPTTNPNIIKAIKLLLKSGKQVFIMTNGLWPKSFQEFIKTLKPEEYNKIGYLFNVLEPTFYSKTQAEKLNESIELINPLFITLGFTIYKKDFDFQYVFNLAKKFEVKAIRWSVCAPNISSDEYTLEKDFKHIADTIYYIYKNAKNQHIDVTSDCGYIPPCFFEKEKLHELFFLSKGKIEFKCSHSPVDIDSAGNAWRCYGLYSVMQNKIEHFKSEKELRHFFDKRTSLLDNIYLYKECATCEFLQKECGGGCYTIRVKRAIKQNPNIVLFPIDDSQEILNCKPRKNEELIIQNRNGKCHLYLGKKVLVNLDSNTM